MIRLFFFFFSVAIVVLALVASSQYAGNWLFYALFTLTANALLFNGFRKRALYFDTFIGVFLWLGFWLKFSFRIAFMSGVFHEPTGGFDGSADAFDRVMLVSACGLAALLVGSWLRERFFAYPDEPSSCSQSGLFIVYRSFRKFFVGGFLLVVVLLAVSNVWLGIYQRGMVAQTVLPFGLNGIYKWMLQFGLASISALIIRFEIELNRHLTLMAVFPPLIEAFFSNVSLLSRGMILNASSLAFGSWRVIGAIKSKGGRLPIVVGASLFAILFVASVFLVNYLRAASLHGTVSGGAEVAVVGGTAQRMTTPLFIDRWVGIEGVMAVSSSEKLGWNLWREAWQEQYREGQLSIYDSAFIDSPYTNPHIDKSKHHFVSLPGIIAFLYYPGSLVFLFVALLLGALAAAMLEVGAYRLCGENWILCSLLAQVIAFRYASFGYVPAQSYLLFGTLLLNCILLFAADHFCRRFLVERLPRA